MDAFRPDYTHVVNAAYNRVPARIPLYEHIISERIMEQILDTEFADLQYGDFNDKREYFRQYCRFYKNMGYDTVSFERCITGILPGGGALGGHKPGVIKTREDFIKYPWDSIPYLFFEKYADDFLLLGQCMPEGMKAVGGPGNGIFECVQDLVGFSDLCYISIDNPELYADLFKKVGNMIYRIWDEFLKRYGDIYCVCRFGDDLGYKSNTLISAANIRTNIVPQYKRIIGLVHDYNKPFLLHSCGRIFDVMEDLINVAGIDAKHSNEDQIAEFSLWIDKYGDRIGIFGGVDTDNLCRKSRQEIEEIVANIVAYSAGRCGFAIGSGNSIPEYVPVSGYLAMVEKVRKIRNG